MASLESQPRHSTGSHISSHLAFLSKARLVMFAALLLIETLLQFIPNPAFKTVAGLASFGAFLAALTGSDRTSVALSIALVAIGSVLFVYIGVDPVTAIASFGENAGVLLIMTLVPLVGIVINLGGYADALGEVSKDVRRPAYLYGISLFLGYAIGSVLLNASIALLWAVLAPLVRHIGKDPGDFLVSSLPRGYNASLMWTPSSPAMATALVLTGAAWPSLFWPGLLVSGAFLVLAVATELGSALFRPSARLGNGSQAQVVSPDSLRKREAWKSISVLTLGLTSFIAAIVILQAMGFTVFQAMVPCIAATLMLWGTLIHKPREIWAATRSYFTAKIPNLSSQFLLMTTAGFIGTALRMALKDGIPGVAWTLQLSLPALTFLTSFLVWTISIAGIHSIIGMTIVYSVIAPFAQGMSPVHMCLTLLLGASLGFNISPVSATILVTSSCAGRNSVEVGVKKQWKFVLATWVAGSIILSLLSL